MIVWQRASLEIEWYTDRSLLAEYEPFKKLQFCIVLFFEMEENKPFQFSSHEIVFGQCSTFCFFFFGLLLRITGLLNAAKGFFLSASFCFVSLLRSNR